MEASMLNRIRKLYRQNSLFLLSKAKGEYWSEVKTTLHNCGSQKEYYRLLCFENRDLQIRERKHECFFSLSRDSVSESCLEGGCCQSYRGLYGFLFREARGTGVFTFEFLNHSTFPKRILSNISHFL
ncbi:nad1 [Capsicum annuum]|nr:hypothetical protein [Capsicum annuum]AIG90027.1 hypothetical protein [Capsicum annuum]KAF3639203.1 nad1 [Capsicum annuum]KAF3641246.1 nad1 [Capsicum annuum]QFV19518.1 hypothetical protein [Capsicum annuum var. glabriusculum]